MEEDTPTQTASTLKVSSVMVEMGALDVKITKLKRAKHTRKVIAVIGVGLSAIWLISYFWASAVTAKDPSSVVLLGPILIGPLIVVGVLLLFFGVVGHFLVSKSLQKAEKSLELLKNTLNDENESSTIKS